jgi:Flp pilus assembly pilin Flp
MLDRINFLATATVLYLADGVESLRKREEGQTMAEYAVVLTLITAAIIATLGVLSGNINKVLSEIAKVIKVS